MLQLGPKKIVPLELIEEKWRALALPQEKLDDLVRIGSFGGETEWLKIFSVAASTLNDVCKHSSHCFCCFGNVQLIVYKIFSSTLHSYYELCKVPLLVTIIHQYTKKLLDL